MESTRSNGFLSDRRSRSASESKKDSSTGSCGKRVLAFFLALTVVFLVCVLYLVDRGSSLYDHESSSATLKNWRRSSLEVVRNLQPGFGAEPLHVPKQSHSSRYKFLAAAREAQTGGHNVSVEIAVKSDLPGAGNDPLYHNFALFERDYADMEKNFKIFVYPEAFQEGGEYSKVFLPHTHPLQKTIGNYYSEHKFKITLLRSKFVTKDPSEADLFFLPFSVNVLRNDMRVRTEANIIRFVKSYIDNVSQEFEYWNRSLGADHFFVCCHSVGRDVPLALPALRTHAIQLVCSSNYYYKNYFPHKDVALPQVWPRKPMSAITPPKQRDRLAFYAGRIWNSNVRKDLIQTWGADPDLDFYAGGSNGSYEKHFQNSKFCVHVRGYEVNTARISDAIHFGCVPIIISDHYDLPLGDILDWSQFSIIISYTRIPDLKKILLAVTDKEYSTLHQNVLKVRKHFRWNDDPEKYDAFHSSMYQLWLKRFVLRESVS